MYALALTLALLGQVPDSQTPSTNYSPPNVAYQGPAAGADVKELKAWLLSRLIIELSFDEAKIQETEKRLDNMNETQVRVLIELYKDRVAKRDQAEAARQAYMQQNLMNQATLNLAQTQAYRDHLKREYDAQVAQRNMEANLVRQNIANVNGAQQGIGIGFPNFGGFGGYGGYFGGGGYYRPNGVVYPQPYIYHIPGRIVR